MPETTPRTAPPRVVDLIKVEATLRRKRALQFYLTDVEEAFLQLAETQRKGAGDGN